MRGRWSFLPKGVLFSLLLFTVWLLPRTLAIHRTPSKTRWTAPVIDAHQTARLRKYLRDVNSAAAAPSDVGVGGDERRRVNIREDLEWGVDVAPFYNTPAEVLGKEQPGVQGHVVCPRRAATPAEANSARFLRASNFVFFMEAGSECQQHITVLTVNVWDSLSHTYGKGVDALAALIKQEGADIVILQELTEEAVFRSVQRSLGGAYHASFQAKIFSRFQLVSVYEYVGLKTTDFRPRIQMVKLHLGNGVHIRVANIHAWVDPNGAKLLKDGDGKNASAVEQDLNSAFEGKHGHGSFMFAWDHNVGAKENEPTLPTIAAGDFNQPSILDHTKEVAKSESYAKERGFKVIEFPWPITKFMKGKGFVDSFRSAHPDPLVARGFTCPPLSFVNDHRVRDRIDYIMIHDGTEKDTNYAWEVVSSRVVDTVNGHEWFSDHNGVLSKLKLVKV